MNELRQASRHAVQSCIGDKSMAICVNLTNLGIKLTLPRQKVGESTANCPRGQGANSINQFYGNSIHAYGYTFKIYLCMTKNQGNKNIKAEELRKCYNLLIEK